MKQNKTTVIEIKFDFVNFCYFLSHFQHNYPYIYHQRQGRNASLALKVEYNFSLQR